MRSYSLTVVVKQSLKDAERKKLLETVKDFIKDAKVTKEDAWGERELSYPIKRETSGFYHNFLFEAEGEFPQGLDKRLMAQEDILRHLLLRLGDVKETVKKSKTVKRKAKN